MMTVANDRAGENSENSVSPTDKRRKNLKSWKKGQSGNPNGKPKKLPEITELLDKVLGEEKKIGGEMMSGIEAMMRSLHAKAVKGDTRASEVLLNRYYGMPKQKTEVESSGNVTIVWKDAKSS